MRNKKCLSQRRKDAKGAKKRMNHVIFGETSWRSLRLCVFARGRLGILCVVVFLAGCASVSERTRGEQSAEFSGRLEEMAAAWLSEPLSLERCVAIALTNNYAVRQADLNVGLAKFYRSMAFGAFLPQVTLSYQSIAYQKDPVMSPQDFSTMAAQITMPVVMPSAWFLYGAAQDGYASAKIVADYTRQCTALQATVGFYAVLVQEDVVAVLEAQHGAAREQYFRMEGLGEEGLVMPWEALQARLQMHAREAELNQARRQLVVARGELLQDLGLSPDAAIVLSRELPPLVVPDGDVAERVIAALGQHLELALADRQVVIRENQVRSAIAQFVPVVALAAQYSRHDKPMMAGMGLPLGNWSGSFNAVWNVFTGFYNLANYRAAKTERERSKLEREKTFLSVIVRVVAADAAFEDAGERLAVAALAYEAAKGRFEDYDARAEEGLLPASDALDARAAMDAAQIHLVQSRYLERIAVESLKLAMGVGVQYE